MADLIAAMRAARGGRRVAIFRPATPERRDVGTVRAWAAHASFVGYARRADTRRGAPPALYSHRGAVDSVSGWARRFAVSRTAVHAALRDAGKLAPGSAAGMRAGSSVAAA